MTKTIGRVMILILAACAVWIWTSGCESSTTLSGDEMRIEPEVHTFGTNDTSVVLNVIGGESPYTWWVADKDLGHLSGVEAGKATGATTVNYNVDNAPPGSVNTVWVRDGRHANPDACWTASATMVTADP